MSAERENTIEAAAPKKQKAKKPAGKKSAEAKKTVFPKIAGVKHFETMEKLMTNEKAPFDKLSVYATKMYKDSQEALAESSRAYAKHMESITKFITEMTQESVERNTEAFRSLWGCKTLQELTEAQTKLAQQNYDDFMTGATKLSELSVKMATEAFEPLNDQFSKTIQKSMAA